MITFSRPRVFVVEQDPAMASSLLSHFRLSGLHTERFESAADFLAEVNSDQPGCVLFDVQTPGMSGVELLEYMKLRNYCIPVIFLTSDGDVHTAVSSMKHGTFDYVEKSEDPNLLYARVLKAIEYDTVLRAELKERHQCASKIKLLTIREIEILKLVVSGLASKQIASTLHISIRTVDKHRGSLMLKLDASNAAELVRIAFESGLTRKTIQPLNMLAMA